MASPPPAPGSQARRVRFEDDYRPTSISLQINFPTSTLKISVKFNPGEMPHVVVRTKRRRHREDDEDEEDASTNKSSAREGPSDDCGGLSEGQKRFAQDVERCRKRRRREEMLGARRRAARTLW